ncbi:MAG: MlaD family protein [Flavobacteriales bacterium]|nr:MlaD family protein [Flavobacteriales bacterium]
MKKISREFWIGVVVVISIAILIVGVNYLKGINLFNKPLTFYAIYPDVGMLGESNPVLMNGYPVGSVSNMGLHPRGDGSIVVEISINDDNLKIPSDSKLRIVTSDLLGSKAIQISIGDSSDIAVTNDTLAGVLEEELLKSIKDELEPLKDKTQKLIASLDEAMTSLNEIFASDGTKGLPKTFESLQNTMENLESATSTFERIIKNNSGRLNEIFTNAESITANIKNNNAQIAHVIQNFAALSDTLAKLQLASTIRKVDKAMSDFELIMGRINNGEGTLGELITNDSLHTGLVMASHSLDLLLNDMRVHPKRYISFSLIGKKDSGELSKKELEQMRQEIDKAIEKKQ